MKKIYFLMLLVTATCTFTNAQISKPKDLSYNIWFNSIRPNYDMSYEEWVFKMISKKGQNIFNIDSTKFTQTNVMLHKEVKQPTILLTTTVTPGDYLIKSRQQILGGTALQITGGFIVYNAVKNIAKLDPSDEKRENKIGTITFGTLIGLIGTGFQIAGIINIGNAGVSLNSNGVGIKISISKQ